jgi:predicted transcriptional regulator
MPAGRDKDVNNTELLRVIATAKGEKVTISDIVDEVPIKRRQLNNRMSELSNEGFVERNKIGNINQYMLTDAGKAYITDDPDESDTEKPED